jgi:predicted transcriptional regulator
MLSKSNVLKTITNFPENFSVDELIDKMILLDKIEKGIQDAEKGDVVSDEDLDIEIEKWLK